MGSPFVSSLCFFVQHFWHRSWVLPPSNASANNADLLDRLNGLTFDKPIPHNTLLWGNVCSITPQFLLLNPHTTFTQIVRFPRLPAALLFGFWMFSKVSKSLPGKVWNLYVKVCRLLLTLGENIRLNFTKTSWLSKCFVVSVPLSCLELKWSRLGFLRALEKTPVKWRCSINVKAVTFLHSRGFNSGEPSTPAGLFNQKTRVSITEGGDQEAPPWYLLWCEHRRVVGSQKPVHVCACHNQPCPRQPWQQDMKTWIIQRACLRLTAE